jgi:hypothetical protein
VLRGRTGSRTVLDSGFHATSICATSVAAGAAWKISEKDCCCSAVERKSTGACESKCRMESLEFHLLHSFSPFLSFSSPNPRPVWAVKPSQFPCVAGIAVQFSAWNLRRSRQPCIFNGTPQLCRVTRHASYFSVPHRTSGSGAEKARHGCRNTSKATPCRSLLWRR